MKIREIFVKVDDVMSVHPDGGASVVEIYTKSNAGLTEKAVKSALNGSKFEFVSVAVKKLKKSKATDAKKTN